MEIAIAPFFLRVRDDSKGVQPRLIEIALKHFGEMWPIPRKVTQVGPAPRSWYAGLAS